MIFTFTCNWQISLVVTFLTMSLMNVRQLHHWLTLSYHIKAATCKLLTMMLKDQESMA